MSKIKVLDSSIFNKIAAGEVVEKPASIIKELVENSIDANASEITIEIFGGGIDRIRVTDNGTGIYPDDIKTAFLPHATSKISSVEDLSNILTLGFRGEALASIASVSKVKLRSKVQEVEFGKKIELSGGEILIFEECAAPNGTQIEVNDLFYNIPARKKFLRKAKTEENEITNLISRYILSCPNIKFNYFCDDKLVFSSTGKGLEDAIYVVYKKEFLDNLIKVDYTNNNIKIHGYISKPTFSKPNRTYQTLIINRRYVLNNLISTAIQNSYESSLMKGQFPAYILNLTINSDNIDVNVHPNKLEVKFDNSQLIYGVFYSAITLALNGFNAPKQISNYKIDETINFSSKKPLSAISGQSYVESEKQAILNSYEELASGIDKSKNFVQENATFNDCGMLGIALENKLKEVELKPLHSTEITSEKANLDTTMQSAMQTEQSRFNFKTNYKVVGTCFNTYIFIEIDEKLYVLDQHACHERLNFDALINMMESKTLNIQTMLVPETFNVNPLESEFLSENLENFKNIGFLIEPFGKDCFKISGIPALFKNLSIKEFLNKVLSDLNNYKKLKTSDLIKNKLATTACKASVRAGDSLTNLDISILIEKMEQNNMKLLCPHGRPAVVEISKNELEKWFKRIV